MAPQRVVKGAKRIEKFTSCVWSHEAGATFAAWGESGDMGVLGFDAGDQAPSSTPRHDPHSDDVFDLAGLSYVLD